MADMGDKSNSLEHLKREIVHKIQSGTVSKEVKDFERLLGKETAELFLEKYAEKHGRLTMENLTSLLSHLNSEGNSSANKPTEHDYIEEMEVELPKDASMSVPDLLDRLMKLESEIHVTRQQRDCLLRYLLRERFLNPKEVKIKEALGRGKHGEVYRAELRDHLYAVKCFQPTNRYGFFAP